MIILAIRWFILNNMFNRYLFLSVWIILGMALTITATTLVPGAINVNGSGLVYYSGKVGIGTVLPVYTLDVNGAGGAYVSSGCITSPIVVNAGGVVDWSTGMFQKVTVGSTNLTLTFKPPAGPGGLLLIIRRSANGGGVVTFPSVKWPGGLVPSFNYSEASAKAGNAVLDIVGFRYDGST